MQRLRTIQWLLTLAAVCLAVAGAVLLGLAVASSGADCTFDNFSCRSNELLGQALRCLAGAVLIGTLSLLVIRRRRHERR